MVGDDRQSLLAKGDFCVQLLALELRCANLVSPECVVTSIANTRPLWCSLHVSGLSNLKEVLCVLKPVFVLGILHIEKKKGGVHTPPKRRPLHATQKKTPQGRDGDAIVTNGQAFVGPLQNHKIR